jgi:hypothetical protein
VSCSDGLDELWGNVVDVNVPPFDKTLESGVVRVIPPCCVLCSSSGSRDFVQ